MKTFGLWLFIFGIIAKIMLKKNKKNNAQNKTNYRANYNKNKNININQARLAQNPNINAQAKFAQSKVQAKVAQNISKSDSTIHKSDRVRISSKEYDQKNAITNQTKPDNAYTQKSDSNKRDIYDQDNKQNKAYSQEKLYSKNPLRFNKNEAINGLIWSEILKPIN